VPSFLEHVETLERWRRFPGRERLDPGSRRVALTFDDGPDPDATPAVLDALDDAGANATFFLVGEQVERHAALAHEVAERGHELGLHGYRHRSHDELGPGARHDLAHGLEAVEGAAGFSPTRYRPPYGRFTEESYAACAELGLEPVYWSGWGCDWEDIGAERIADLVVRDLRDGAVVVLHDSARYGHRPSAVPTVQALPAIAGAARRAALALTGLS
jgi:peptidoglycan-N-acetylglucosamine deacetylase